MKMIEKIRNEVRIWICKRLDLVEGSQYRNRKWRIDEQELCIGRLGKTLESNYNKIGELQEKISGLERRHKSVMDMLGPVKQFMSDGQEYIAHQCPHCHRPIACRRSSV